MNMTQNEVVDKFHTYGLEPIFNQTTGVVYFYDFPGVEISISEHRVFLHFPKGTIVESSLATFTKFSDLMSWLIKQHKDHVGLYN